MSAFPDPSGFDIKIRAQFLRDLFSRLVLILQIYCGGDILVPNDRIDETYIKLCLQIEGLLDTDGLESLLDAYPRDSIPGSLHSIDADADIDWECRIQQALNSYKGEILKFCVRIGAKYDDEKDFKLVLSFYDLLIDSYKKLQEKEWQKGFVEPLRRQNNTNDQGSAPRSPPAIFVDLERIKELKAISSSNFDLRKLVKGCEELNVCYSNGCYLAVAMLTRSILNHTPPIFGCKNFSEVANNRPGGIKSFKDSMLNLENSSRKIADAHLHCQIRSKETLPNKTQVNFSNDLDVLLAEIVRILS